MSTCISDFTQRQQEFVAQLLQVQISFGGGDNRNGARPIMAKPPRKHGQDAGNRLLGVMRLGRIFGFARVPPL